MLFLTEIFIDDTNISNLPNPAPSIPVTSKITDLFTKGGFNLINFVFILIGLAFFANLIIAGWEFMLSQGDPKKTAAASTRITNGLIGLIMVVGAFVVVKLVTSVLGLNLL